MTKFLLKYWLFYFLKGTFDSSIKVFTISSTVIFKLFGKYTPSYSSLTPSLLLTVIQSIEIWLAYFYNKYYTSSLLADGYYPLENDKFAEIILKDYSYLPYTKEELEDEATMEKYKEISTFARKEERSKAYSVIGIWGILFIIGIIVRFLGVN